MFAQGNVIGFLVLVTLFLFFRLCKGKIH